MIYGGAIAAIWTMASAALALTPAGQVPILNVVVGAPLLVPILITWLYILGDNATPLSMAGFAALIGLAINVPIGCFLGRAYRDLRGRGWKG